MRFMTRLYIHLIKVRGTTRFGKRDAIYSGHKMFQNTNKKWSTRMTVHERNEMRHSAI